MGSQNLTVGYQIAVPIPSANFTRPNDTTAYASGDLVANNTTAGSVVPMSFTVSRQPSVPMLVRRARLKKSTNVTTSASFRLHLYQTTPTVSNGDNGAWLSSQSGYLGALDITVDKAFSDPAAEGIGAPNNGVEINGSPSGAKTIFGLLEARAAYTPGAQEIFTVELEVWQS